MEGDKKIMQVLQMNVKFQSTPSAWRETSIAAWNNKRYVISIHSLRMEGDVDFIDTVHHS